MPGHVYWKDRQRVLQGCNDQQAKDAGLASRHDIAGKTAYDLIWPDQPEADRRAQSAETDRIDENVMQTDMPQTVEEFVVLPDGSTATFLSKKNAFA